MSNSIYLDLEPQDVTDEQGDVTGVFIEVAQKGQLIKTIAHRRGKLIAEKSFPVEPARDEPYRKLHEQLNSLQKAIDNTVPHLIGKEGGEELSDELYSQLNKTIELMEYHW